MLPIYCYWFTGLPYLISASIMGTASGQIIRRHCPWSMQLLATAKCSNHSAASQATRTDGWMDHPPGPRYTTWVHAPCFICLRAGTGSLRLDKPAASADLRPTWVPPPANLPALHAGWAIKKKTGHFASLIQQPEQLLIRFHSTFFSRAAAAQINRMRQCVNIWLSFELRLYFKFMWK